MDYRLRENAIVTVSLPASGPLLRVSDFHATVIALRGLLHGCGRT
jgi:hypothetical protein